MAHDYDWIIVGGGLVGCSVAYGLAQQNPQARILVLDGADVAPRPSRGNFGLIWVQGKGADFPAYANWSFHGAQLWPDFAHQLEQQTQVDLAYQCQGGLEFAFSDDELAALSRDMQAVAEHTQGRFQYQVLDHAQACARQPGLGPDVAGATFSAHDGQVNPLYLLAALQQAMQQLGVTYVGRTDVRQVQALGEEQGQAVEVAKNGFRVTSTTRSWQSQQVVLCAGLDNQRLGEQLAMHLPVSAVKGQILITEPCPPVFKYASPQVRQTAEGTLQIGGSHEHCGLDDASDIDVMQKIASDAISLFPQLSDTQLVRSWGALRIMSPDGAPIYQASKQYPGAFGVVCHSGVSLAAAHAGPLASWLSGTLPDGQESHWIQSFDSERFHV